MNRKKILIVTRGIYPSMSANSEIAYRLAKVLKDKFLCDITFIGGDKQMPKGFSPDNQEYRTIFIKSFIKYSLIKNSTPEIWKRMFKIFKEPACLRYFLNMRINSRYALSKEYQYAIEKTLKRSTYDCIICFCNPKDTLCGVSKVNTKVPFIAYKLDPWSTHYKLQNRKIEWRAERKVDLKAAAIVTTDLIRKEYPKEVDPEILKKIHVLQFPNVIDYSSRKERIQWEEPATAHCAYVGSVYRDIRNPEYTAKVFDALDKYGIKLHMVGFQFGGTGLLESLPETVICHGKVTSEEALSYMQSADILVNIGNTITNQMPSKILTYISLGKPIINFVKNPDCPTLPYLEKYPLVLNIFETEFPKKEDIERVYEFIKNNRGKQIPFETIKDLYNECTPEYVSEQLYHIIEDIT